MNFVTTDQPLKPEQQKLVEEVYKRLDLFEQANRPYHEAAKEARAIVRLKDPEQDPEGTPEAEKTLQLQESFIVPMAMQDVYRIAYDNSVTKIYGK